MTKTLSSGRFFGTQAAQQRIGPLRITESVYAGAEVLPPHAHESAHFCFVVAGGYAECIGRRQYERQTGTVLWYPRDITHSERHYVAGRHLLVEVDDSLLERADVVRASNDPRDLASPDASWFAHRIVRDYRDHDDDVVALSLEASILGLLSETARAGRMPNSEPAWLRRIDRLFLDQPAVTPTLEALAAHAGVHPSHLARTWRRFRGRTLGEEARRARVRLACSLLTAGDEPLVEIAARTGFAELLATQVFQPAGMSSSLDPDARDVVPARARPYLPGRGEVLNAAP